MRHQQDASHNWEKVLWRRQDYPDNYVPPIFLASLRRNPNLRQYRYRTLVLSACAITQHLAIIFIFLSVFVRLKENLLDARSLVCMSTALFILGYAVWVMLLTRKSSMQAINHLKAFKSSIMMFLVLVSLSPVLRTLTAATSSDSIWALAAFLFVLNVVLADYRAIKPAHETQEGLTSVLSVNAAVSASVVLASRLSTNVDVFALILLSILVFALYPTMRHLIQDVSGTIWLLVTAFLFVIAITLVVDLSRTVMWIYAVILLFVNFGAPAILIWAQRYKNIIRGPWDAAVPKVN